MIAALPPPVLEVYYSPTCAPCRLELPVLADFAKADGSRVRIVILDQEARARGELRAVSPALEKAAVMRHGEKPRAVLLAAGDTDGILPFARSLIPKDKVCGRWRGGLTPAKARELVQACARIISPGRR
ncbi:MAG TPA: hypothetical protein VG889_13415 [Rhizomicrobium sp.]|nr:hypothetical protein [Rhizomicrobium sp.]